MQKFTKNLLLRHRMIVMLYDTNSDYQKTRSMATIIFLTMIHNTLKIITLEDCYKISLYTKSSSYLTSHNNHKISNISASSEEIELPDNKNSETWKSIQVALGIGLNIILFLTALCILIKVNIKLSIATILIAFILITCHQFFNIYHMFETQMSKLFTFIEMHLFILLSTSVLMSLFNSFWIILYTATFLICYIIYIIKLGNLTNIMNEGIIRNDCHTFAEKYSNLLDLLNITMSTILLIVISIFAKHLSIYKDSKTFIPTSQVSTSQMSKFFIKDDSTMITTSDFTNSPYLLSINDNKVMLHTQNNEFCVEIGSYANNKIHLTISDHVQLNIQTGFYNNKWFSQIKDNQIYFNDGNSIIAGPKLNNELMEISFNKNDIHTLNMNNVLIPMPCGTYQLDTSMSKFANKSSLNAVDIDIYNSGDNKCEVYQMYYPGTDILIGECNYEQNSLCTWINLTANVNGRPIFQLLNGNILYLSPLSNQYIYIDTTFNLNNNGIFFAMSTSNFN